MKGRPRSGRLPFLGLVLLEKTQVIVVASGGGKVGNLLLVFHFSMAAKPGGGNVGVSRFLRDFQGTVESAGKLLLLFRSFHGPVISTALYRGPDLRCRCLPPDFKLYESSRHARRRPYLRPGSGDSLLHRRSSCPLAAAIFRAHSVSLICRAVCSSCTKLTCGFKCRSAFSTPFSFSYGVA